MAYRVLLVDDDAAVLRTMVLVLESAKYQTDTAASAEEAIVKLAENAYDLVITDMRMETSTAGFDVVRAAKGLPAPPLVAILSAYPMQPEDWRSCGADAMFHKGGGGVMRMIEDLSRLLESAHRDATAS